MPSLTLDLNPDAPVDASAKAGPATAGDGHVGIAPVRLVVADDHPLYRQGVIRALEAYGGFLVVGEAGDGADALQLIRSLQPDIALLDVRMPILDGVDVVHALALHGPDVPVVLLSAFSDRQLVDSGLQAGAAAYINKTQERDAICLQLATIADSGAVVAPGQLSPRDRLSGGAASWSPRLTCQEHELLQLASKDLDKLAAAEKLDIHEAEIRHRASSVMRKLDADTLGEAVSKARARGLIR